MIQSRITHVSRTYCSDDATTESFGSSFAFWCATDEQPYQRVYRDLTAENVTLDFGWLAGKNPILLVANLCELKHPADLEAKDEQREKYERSILMVEINGLTIRVRPGQTQYLEFAEEPQAVQVRSTGDAIRATLQLLAR